MRVSTQYKIKHPLPFLDVHVDQDNRLFLDPSAIRVAAHRGRPYAKEADRKLKAFFEEAVRCSKSSLKTDKDSGVRMLHSLNEPNETRLGMSKQGAKGRAMGTELGSRLWQELIENPACQYAAVTRLEDVPLFVEGIGEDRISDATTRVIFQTLVEFTTECMRIIPKLNIDTRTHQVDVWESKDSPWHAQSFELPHPLDKPLLLIPRDWVFWRLVTHPPSFYNCFATRSIQEERTKTGRGGRLIKPSKKTIKKASPEVKATNVQQAVKYIQNDRNLVDEYRENINATHCPMNDNDIRYKTPERGL